MIDRTGSTAEDDGSDDEQMYNAICDLFGAADRVAADPKNAARCLDLVDATKVVVDKAAPFGLRDDEWWEIRSRATAASESIEDDEGDEAVQEAAARLRDILRAYV
jgi:hypothetical protein